MFGFNDGIITIKMHTNMTHALLKLRCQTAVIPDYLLVSACTVAKIARVLRVKRPL